MRTIRPLKSKSELDAYLELCVYCFSMSREYTSYYADFVGPHLEHTWGAFDDGRLIAAMWAVPFEMNVGGAYLPMGGVAAVATYPEARNAGLAKTLMTRAHRDMKSRGCALAVLQPFKPEFYARMGYGDVFYQLECAMKPSAIALRDLNGYLVVPVEGLHEWKTFESLHQAYGVSYFGAVKRSQSYWKQRFFTTGMGLRYHYLIVKGKKAHGFIITHVDKAILSYSRDGSQPSRLSIVQATWNDQGSFDAILHFIRSHADQFDKIAWRVPTDVSVHERLADQRIDVAIKPKMMLKLVDLKAAIEQRPWPDDLKGEVYVQVKGDDTSPWNDGLWRVRWNRGEASVSKASAASRSATVTTDIQTLAVLYSGHRSATRLTELGSLSGPKAAVELLDCAFPRHPCYIDDWF